MKFTTTSARFRHAIVTCALTSISLVSALAGTDSKDMSVAADLKPAPAAPDWTLELGSGVLFSNVRDTTLDNYVTAPVDLTAGYAVDEDSLDNFAFGIFRGHTDFLFRAFDDVIAKGREHHIYGMEVGPRYNFVQPGWKLVPFVEGTVGFGFADSNPEVTPVEHGLGQDFNFTFSVALGARYDITDNWYVRLAAVYSHYSNAGLSEPHFSNRAIDNAGPELSVGTRF